MPKKKTHEEFIEEMKIKNPNIKILDKYINSTTEITCQCLIDNYIWKVQPKSLSCGRGCPKCGGTLKLTNENFIERVKEINPNIILISDYKIMKDKVKCKCLIDGTEWYAYPQNLLKGHGCPKCATVKASKRLTKSHDDFIKDIKTISPTISILNTYKNNKSKIKCKCSVCENTWSTDAANLIAGKGCPKCGLKTRITAITKTQCQFEEEIRLINNKIKIIGKYINSNTPIKCKCLIDGHIWSAMPLNLLKGTGCPICANSHGEQQIVNFLKEFSIEFIPQYKFEDCKNIRTLPFDFYLPQFNMCIEYDGEQHFRPVNFGGCTNAQAIKAFNKTKNNDFIKTTYCKHNNINLLRIKYSDFNKIEKIIQNILS